MSMSIRERLDRFAKNPESVTASDIDELFRDLMKPPRARSEPEVDAKRVEALAAKAIEDGFKKVLEQPLVKLAIKTDGEDSETLNAVLRTVYEAGFHSGTATALMDMIQQMKLRR